ncbi:glycosyltransferase [Acidisphaera sp. S103]|uniref:glycosyltransferase n=1 Tax=Acidisphaera sp. S103 TaxID=1747223 RepID=UPI00131C89A0|nr:glycosyltransferase [Acidisphaera sp. S103]
MTTLAILALLIWIYLVFAHGMFWQAGPVLPVAYPATAPSVAIVVPARDEAPVIEATMRSLLAQDYAGSFRVILTDDNSTDGTGDIVRGIGDPRVTVIAGAPRPAGWSGKLWAVSQGVVEADDAELILLTDADIVHEPAHLSCLVALIEQHGLDLVSEMVKLACESRAERGLVPAFVYFFQLLYPFAWVNDGLKGTAAAAGGTILIRQRALRRIGGVESVRGALIDDVALATAVKKGGRIWLGHADLARSVRPYPAVIDIWRMITRTAFVQLRYSLLLLIATTLGMALVWLVPPVAALFGHGRAFWCGVAAWMLLSASYLPTLTRFGRSPLWAPFLPLVACFYMAATIGSAVNHFRGAGVAWKGRAYPGTTG